LPFSISARVEVEVTQPTSSSANLILFFRALVVLPAQRVWCPSLTRPGSFGKTRDFHCLLVYLFPAQKFYFLIKPSVREPS
jgi:hypothetical protein